MPCPFPGDRPNPGIEPRSRTLQVDSLPSKPPGKSYGLLYFINFGKSLAIIPSNNFSHSRPPLDSNYIDVRLFWGFLGGSDGQESAHNVGSLDSIPGSRRFPGEGMATHFSILAWKSHGQRSLVVYSPQGHIESDMTEQLTQLCTWTSGMGHYQQSCSSLFPQPNAVLCLSLT